MAGPWIGDMLGVPQVRPILIDLARPYEEGYWCVMLSVDAAVLRMAVETAGADLHDVCRHLDHLLSQDPS